ncbi:unnamed protein product, partial [Tilletia caries]
MPSASTSAFEFAPYVPATSTSPMNQIIPVSAPSNNGGADQSGIAAFDFSNFMAPSTSGSASMSLPTNQPPHTSPPSTASVARSSASPSQDPSKRHNRGRGAVQKRRLEPRASQESSKKKGKRADPAAASAAESSSSEAATSVALRGGYRLRGGDVRSRSAATSSTGSATSSTGSPRSRSAATASRSAAATSSTGSATSSPGSPLSRSVATSSASSSLVVAPGSARASDVAVVTAPTALAATSRPARNSNAAMRAGTPMPWRYLGLVRWHDGATDGVPLTSDEANIEAERSAVPSSSSGPDGSNDGSDSRTKRLSHLREAWAVNSAPRSDTNTSAGPAISPSTFIDELLQEAGRVSVGAAEAFLLGDLEHFDGLVLTPPEHLDGQGIDGAGIFVLVRDSGWIDGVQEVAAAEDEEEERVLVRPVGAGELCHVPGSSSVGV